MKCHLALKAEWHFFFVRKVSSIPNSDVVSMPPKERVYFVMIRSVQKTKLFFSLILEKAKDTIAKPTE